MNVYIPLIFAIIFFGYLAENNAKQQKDLLGPLPPEIKYGKNIYVIITAVLLILVAGLRYKVGADYGMYVINYTRYAADKITFIEPGIRLIARLAKLIYNDYATMFFLASLITVGLTVWTLARKTQWFFISILLYVFSSIWHGSFNGIRQYLAAAVLFAGHRFIIERKLFGWLVVVFIASMFHTTAVLMVFWYFVATHELNWKQWLFILAIIIVGIYSYDYIWQFAGFLNQADIDTSRLYMAREINHWRIAFQWMPVLFFLILRPPSVLSDLQSRFYLNMGMINAALMTASMNSAYLGRVGIYTYAFTLILWPILLKSVEGNARAVFTSVLLLCYAGFWYFEASKTSLQLFSWIFNR